MKILSMKTHSPIDIDGKTTSFLHENECDFTFQDSWILIKSKRTGTSVAVPAANVPYLNIDFEVKAKKKGE